MEMFALRNEMIKTKTKLKDLLEMNKDLDPMYVFLFYHLRLHLLQCDLCGFANF